MSIEQTLLEKIDLAITKGDEAKKTASLSRTKGGLEYVPYADYQEFKSTSLSVLSSVTGINHTYYTEFQRIMQATNTERVEAGIRILKTLRYEIEKGWLITLKQLVTAEIFSDFLEMSEHLLSNNYKDAAAVMIGSVLEEHLRQLCKSHTVDTTIIKGTDVVPKKADLLNADLAKAGVYNLIQQKAIIGWLGLRNSAAHGQYAEYTLDQVRLMYQGVLDFIGRTT